MIRKLFSLIKKEAYINSSTLIRSDEASREDVFDHIYDIKKFTKWFNFFPFCWLSFDKEKFDVGCTGTIRFTIPFFYYKLKVVKVIPNKSIEFISSDGPLKGNASFTFTQTEDGIVFGDPHHLTGRNKLIHLYYSIFLAPNHIKFMNWRYKILKKNLLIETKKRKGNSTYEK
ncbi:MAG: hypothetical protein KAX49_11290 [Halanaerobiales bacterium]|nr:hypothetical protein [Halanaerobiales bacterium]